MQHLTEHYSLNNCMCIALVVYFHTEMVLSQGRKEIAKKEAENVLNPLYYLLNRVLSFGRHSWPFQQRFI